MTSFSAPLSSSRTEQSPIGAIEVQVSQIGLTQVRLLGHKVSFAGSVPEFEGSSLSYLVLDQILEYLDGKRQIFDFPIDWAGVTAFYQKVLNLAQKVAFGEVWTYGRLARESGNPSASRAIGSAMAHNPMPIVIPCHRVVAADGRLTGYSAADGIETKAWLLKLEGHQVLNDRLVFD